MAHGRNILAAASLSLAALRAAALAQAQTFPPTVPPPGIGGVLGMTRTAQADPSPADPAPASAGFEPAGSVHSPHTAQLNQRMLEQIQRNPGAPMASGPIVVVPAPTVTYQPQAQAQPPQALAAPYPPLWPERRN